jgi:ferredoxin
MPPRTLTVNQEECIGCETCMELCPSVFSVDPGTGKSKVLDQDGACKDDIQEAIDSCPVEAIAWAD